MAITITERAAGEVKRVKEEQKLDDELFLRIGVAGGGCSGFNYTLGFDNNYDAKKDSKYNFHGVNVVVDKKSAVLGRHHGGLVRKHRTPRFHVRKPQRREDLRLRQFVPGVAGAAHANLNETDTDKPCPFFVARREMAVASEARRFPKSRASLSRWIPECVLTPAQLAR